MIVIVTLEVPSDKIYKVTNMVELAKKKSTTHKNVIVMLRKEYFFYVRKAVSAALIVVLKVFFLRFDPHLDTPTNFGDVLYRDAHVEKMIASEAFCHILRSSRKSIGCSNARIGPFLARNIKSEASHLI